LLPAVTDPPGEFTYIMISYNKIDKNHVLNEALLNYSVTKTVVIDSWDGYIILAYKQLSFEITMIKPIPALLDSSKPKN
jgi:hypothetical protein